MSDIAGFLMSFHQASLAAAWLFPHLAETACTSTAELHAQTHLCPALAGLVILLVPEIALHTCKGTVSKNDPFGQNDLPANVGRAGLELQSAPLIGTIHLTTSY